MASSSRSKYRLVRSWSVKRTLAITTVIRWATTSEAATRMAASPAEPASPFSRPLKSIASHTAPSTGDRSRTGEPTKTRVARAGSAANAVRMTRPMARNQITRPPRRTRVRGTRVPSRPNRWRSGLSTAAAWMAARAAARASMAAALASLAAAALAAAACLLAALVAAALAAAAALPLAAFTANGLASLAGAAGLPAAAGLTTAAGLVALAGGGLGGGPPEPWPASVLVGSSAGFGSAGGLAGGERRAGGLGGLHAWAPRCSTGPGGRTSGRSGRPGP